MLFFSKKNFISILALAATLTLGIFALQGQLKVEEPIFLPAMLNKVSLPFQSQAEVGSPKNFPYKDFSEVRLECLFSSQFLLQLLLEFHIFFFFSLNSQLVRSPTSSPISPVKVTDVDEVLFFSFYFLPFNQCTCLRTTTR